MILNLRRNLAALTIVVVLLQLYRKRALTMIERYAGDQRRFIVRCVEDGCNAAAKGYDIEKAIDRDNCPVYVVYYSCSAGHEFIAEYDRALSTPEDLQVMA